MRRHLSIYLTLQTSTLQRAALTDFLDLRFIPGEDGKLEGANTVTVFAPSNRAFQALPKKLQLFLFSTYGGSALQKLLQYHIVPNLSLHSGKWSKKCFAFALLNSLQIIFTTARNTVRMVGNSARVGTRTSKETGRITTLVTVGSRS